MLSRLVITFLPRSKGLLISRLQSPSAVILEPKKLKSVTVSPSICHEVMGPDAMILVFWMLSFKPTFSLSSITFMSVLPGINLMILSTVPCPCPYWLSMFFFFLRNLFLFIYFFKFYFIFKLYIIVLVLPNIKMNPPQVYMCSPSWTLLPPPYCSVYILIPDS